MKIIFFFYTIDKCSLDRRRMTLLHFYKLMSEFHPILIIKTTQSEGLVKRFLPANIFHHLAYLTGSFRG